MVIQNDTDQDVGYTLNGEDPFLGEVSGKIPPYGSTSVPSVNGTLFFLGRPVPPSTEPKVLAEAQVSSGTSAVVLSYHVDVVGGA